jgi:hypothetical protein
MREIGWRGGEALTMIQPPNPYLGMEFSMEETQNRQWEGLGTKSCLWKREERSAEQIRRERGSRVGFEDRSYRSDRYEKPV